jgi:hypothetical protein
MLLDVEAYTSDVRGEPCAAARDRTDGLVSVRICAGRGVGGPREQENPIPSALPAGKASSRIGSAGRYDLDWEDDTGGKRRETAGGEVQRAEMAALLEGRVEGFAQTTSNWEWSKRGEQTKLNLRERVAFTRRRGVFMGM